MSFSADLKAFAQKTNTKTELAVKSIVAGVAESVIEMSPVGDATYWTFPAPAGYTGGRFRANWDYGFNTIPTAQYDTIDKTIGTSMNRVEGGYAGKPMAGHYHYIANNLPYAQRLEEGYSRQAPQGMVSLTVIKWQSIVRDVLNGLK